MSTLPERFWSKVNKTPTCWLWIAALDPAGYGRFRWDGENRLAHRVAYAVLVGPIPDGWQVDHQCHVEACVRPSHLLAVTNKLNTENRRGAQRNSASGVRGVAWDRNTSKWRVQVGHNGKSHHGGSYADVGEAERVAIALRNSLHTNNLRDRGLTV